MQSDCGPLGLCRTVNGIPVCTTCGGTSQECCFNNNASCNADLACVQGVCDCGSYYGVTMFAGTAQDHLISCDGRFKLVMQTDGNLVLYMNGTTALWSTGTVGSGATQAAMQTDGNFVLYAGATPVWASNTAGHPNAVISVQNDGNVVIYYGSPIWATNTCCH
jgi:hypothetical protein